MEIGEGNGQVMRIGSDAKRGAIKKEGKKRKMRRRYGCKGSDREDSNFSPDAASAALCKASRSHPNSSRLLDPARMCASVAVALSSVIERSV
jgi:hypothetical protein